MSDADPHPPTPSDPRVVAECVPAELKPLPRWACWKAVPNTQGGKPTKLPISVHTGRPASSTDPLTWATFGEAITYMATDPSLSGVMLALSPELDLVGIDLDGCRDADGQLTPEAKALVETFDTYTEISPSGTGVKLLCYGSKPGNRCRKKGVLGCHEIEVYSEDRFFVITGLRLDGVSPEVEDRQVELDDLYAQLFPPKPERPKGSRGSADGFTGDDEALLDKARQAANGPKFTRLYDGGDVTAYGGDDSAADMALVSMLAFWTGPDPARIDRLFRGSALMREKWDREDYRRTTIERALEGITEFYGARPVRVSVSGGPLPEVELGPDEHRVICEVVEALASDPDLYQRGGQLVRVIWVAESGAARPVIREVELPTLRELITRNIILLKRDKEGELVPAHPPGWLVTGVHARGEWPSVRTLTAISRSPVLRSDGSVVQTPGYDAATGVLYLPSGVFPVIPDDVNLDDANAAMERLMDLTRDFPFASEAHKAAWLAGLLTIVGRHAFTGNAPLFLVDANTRGAGKTLLAQVAGTIALGHSLPVSTYSHDAVEMRKAITTMVMAGEQVVLLDNLSGVLGNEAVDRQLTSPRWRDRVLGGNAQVDLPMTTVLWATGNNVSIHADTARRTIHIRLDSPLERPEDRDDFRQRDLLAYVAEHRAELYVDAVIILAAYLRAGCPQAEGVHPLGSFEGWSTRIRGAVIWTGLPDPRSTRDGLEIVADSGKDTLSLLITAFELYDPKGEGVVISDAVSAVYGDLMGALPSDAASVGMRAALEALAGRDGKSPSPRQVSNKLKAYRRRVIDGRMLDFDPAQKRPGGHAWKVVRRESQA